MKKFTNENKCNDFIKSNNWCKCYVKIGRFYIAFNSLELYVNYVENNLK